MTTPDPSSPRVADGSTTQPSPTLFESAKAAMPMAWIRKLRLKVYAVLAAVALAGFAVVSWTTAPVWPVVFGAVAVVAVCVNTMTSKLRVPTCWVCGHDVSEEPMGAYGRICPSCGAVSEPSVRLAVRDADELHTDAIDREALETAADEAPANDSRTA